MTQDELDQIQVDLKIEADKIGDEIRVLKQRKDLLTYKLHWITGVSRYGDIIEMQRQYGRKSNTPVVERMVVTDVEHIGTWRICRPVRKDGMLSKNRRAETSLESVVDRYVGSDLPEPDEAAQFGLDHPVPR